VEVVNATELYQHSFQPKTFVSPNGSDHLLSYEAKNKCSAQTSYSLNLTSKHFRNQPILRRFSGVSLFVFLFVILFFNTEFTDQLAKWTACVIGFFGGYYLFLGFGAVLVMLTLALLPVGRLRLGDENPEFGWGSWIAMLYSTGMGGGLLLRAVQEPVYYFQNPPREFDIDRKTFAMEYTYFHWGLTPWAFYGLLAVIIGFNIYRNNGTALNSSILKGNWNVPLLGAILDLLTVLCTLFGVVAGVGLGSRQLLEAISYWSGIRFGQGTAILPLLLVCLLAMASAYFGVRRGIKLLSNVNISGAILLFFFALILGNTWHSVTIFFSGIGNYLLDFAPMSLNLGYAKVEESFLSDWTYFYWAFWLSWAPFTGVFIARISKGRTIRELVLGTLIVPALGTFAWFSVFGANGIWLVETGRGDASQFTSIYSSLFNYLAFFPFSTLSNLLASVLVMTFLVTSIDSAIFVLSVFSDQGKAEPSQRLRIFWGLAIFIFAAIIMWLGKDGLLEAISNLLILFALPFSFVFVFLILHFIRIVTKTSNHEKP
jgi:glycine betaine transporter